MKKTLLATAIVGALGASAAAQAATVYDQDGTKLDVYGRIAMGVAGGGPEFNGAGQEVDDGAEFVDVYSRLGLRMSQEITSDLTAFGRVEWRFDGDERTGPSGNGNTGFKEVRQSYIGLQSDQFGTIQGGNFDAFYNQFVSLPFDVYIDRGFEFAGHPTQSRGDSIGYYTPDLSGFTVFLQGKHYSSRGELEPSDGSEVAAQGGVRYAQGPVTLGLGFVDDIVEGGGNDEVRYGLIGSYDFTDQFSARLGYETRDENDNYTPSATGENGFDTVGLGGTFTTGPWAFALDYYNINRDNRDDSNAWAAGSYYKVSSNFDVFLELADGDAPTVDRDVTLGDLTDDVYWLTGARYHF
ncbi:porin [Halomonas sp. FeN2]|uniref:porin n=1 Tax=Halomonas sp. FeN2 TaxID=2832500 RepID=UPI000C5ED177|nr:MULTISPECIES: porin [unclassified Halomonas]MBF57538.1 porin [Halomonas sp.]TDV99120.1 putative porin [Halomonas alkaliantarctica]UBR49413.1 porin [Halomonas sp. FeN2]|tara:strand:- start:7258 stop:8316 length:1059 start_codon:yes stop_codon:yes gene_type:complete